MEKIEHIVLSGGGIGGIVEYGAIKYLIKQNIISMSNIKSFYGTSIDENETYIIHGIKEIDGRDRFLEIETTIKDNQ